MKDGPARRGVLAVCVVGLVAIVCLLLGHKWLQGYLDDQRTKRLPAAPEPPDGAVTGEVSFADGTPVASARISIRWKDSAGRAGDTPSLTDGSGRFRQPNVPADATLTEVRAAVGPLAVSMDGESLARADAAGGGFRLSLPAKFRLAGLVRRTGDRQPVAGATLEIAGARATSAEDGTFAVDGIAASALAEMRPVVRIAADGMKPLEWPLPKDALPETYQDLTILLEPAK
jgi:hypothetical protein